MKTLQNLSKAEIEALVYSLECLGEKAYPGVNVGPGRQVDMPKSITREDICSGDPKRWIGWTHAGPDAAGTIRITDERAVQIATEKGDLVKDSAALSLAQAALSKAVESATVQEASLEAPDEPAVKRKSR